MARGRHVRGGGRLALRGALDKAMAALLMISTVAALLIPPALLIGAILWIKGMLGA